MGKNHYFYSGYLYPSGSSYNRISIKRLIPILMLITGFWLLFPSGAIAFCPSLQVKNQAEVKKENIKFPETVAARKAEMFWGAFKAEDRAALEAFFEQVLSAEKLRELPASQRAQRLLLLRQKLGAELKAQQVLSPSPDEISIIFSSDRNDLFRLTLSFEVQIQELRLKSLTVDEAGPEGLAPALPAMSLSRALQGIEEEIDRAVREDRFSGVVLIAMNFRPVYFKPYGLASKEFNVPNRLDTKFNLGSINKIFTKIAIARLAQEGRLSLDEKLGKFLPDYPNVEAREKVTVRHLVNMSSGLGDFFGPEFRNTPKDFIRHNRDYLRFLASKPLAFEPGSKEMYSNGGYVVLGEIISAATGMDYYDCVRKNIFEPAGMKDSDWFEADSVVENVAEGYTKQREEPEKLSSLTWRRNIYTRPARGSAAGGGYATAEDLLRFIRALYEGRLLSEVWTHWIFTGIEPEGPARGHKNSIKSGEINKTFAGYQSVNRILETGGPDDLKEQARIIRLQNCEPANLRQTKDSRSKYSAMVSTGLAQDEMETESWGTLASPIRFIKGPAAFPPEPGYSRNRIEGNPLNLTLDRRRWGLGLAGGAPGINAVLEFEARTGFTVIVLANYDPPAAIQMGRMIRRYLGAVKK